VFYILFGFKDRQLNILLIKRKESPKKGGMALPGDFLNKDERLPTSAKNIKSDYLS
jgi:ADP-ribose pyrophosphatase YjhB (NUDIX family)